MSDQTLLMFGVAVTFIFVAGVYVYVQERYEGAPQKAPQVSEPTRVELGDDKSKT